MEFTLVDRGNNIYAFENVENDERLAEIAWQQNGDTMVMDHTVVSDKLQGKGVARQLLDTAAQYARDNNYKMEAVCSYVVTMFKRSDAYDDIKAQ